jgi:hypothetical protein
MNEWMNGMNELMEWMNEWNEWMEWKIMQHELHNTGENSPQEHIPGYFQAATE